LLQRHQAKSALESVRDKLKDNAIILLMCNGMGILEELAPLVSDTCNFLLASNTHGVKWEAEGHLVHTGKGVIRIGSPFSTSLSLEDIVCDLEIQTGLNWIHDSNIMVNLFKKLAVNVCINSSTALINCRNGDLSKLGPYWNRLVETLCKEVCKVAKMKNVHLDLSSTIQFVHEVAEKTAKNTSSMLADVNAQRLTEVDYINGYIARHGGRVNEAVQDLIHMREKMYTA
jgi:2-dehydropantoate 2-reductase